MRSCPAIVIGVVVINPPFVTYEIFIALNNIYISQLLLYYFLYCIHYGHKEENPPVKLLGVLGFHTQILTPFSDYMDVIAYEVLIRVQLI